MTPAPRSTLASDPAWKGRASLTQRLRDVRASDGHLQMARRRAVGPWLPEVGSASHTFRCHRCFRQPLRDIGCRPPCAWRTRAALAPWTRVRHASSLGFRGSAFGPAGHVTAPARPLQSGPSHLSDCVLSEHTHRARCKSHVWPPRRVRNEIWQPLLARGSPRRAESATRLLAPDDERRLAVRHLILSPVGFLGFGMAGWFAPSPRAPRRGSPGGARSGRYGS